MHPMARGFADRVGRVVPAALAMWLAVLAWLIASPVFAQPAGDSGASARLVEAPVVVFNRTVATLRTPFLGTPPADRARRARELILEILGRGGPGKVAVRSEPQGNAIMIDGELAFLLTPDDADRLRGESLEATTASAVKALEVVAAETHESRDRTRLLRALGKAALATLVFVGALWGTWRARTWLVAGLARRLETGTSNFSFAGMQLLHGERLIAIARLIVSCLSWALLGFLAYQWFAFVFNQFPYTRPWGEQLHAFLVGVGHRIGGAMLRAIPDLVIALIIFLLARAVIGLFSPFFDRARFSRRGTGWLDADTAQPTKRIFNIAVWLFAIVMAYPYLPGSDSDAFKGVSVLVGLMVTVGGSNLFSQAASGMILMYSRTARVGEYVRINDQEGTITELGTFTTRIRTGLGEEVTLPNALVLGTVTKNYSRTVRGPGYIVDTTITIGYDTPWRQVEAMLLEAAHRTPGVLESPPPRVFQTALSDFYPQYRLVCQAIPDQPRPRAEVLAALHANIQDVFNENNVQIMSPHYVADPAAPKLVSKDNWFAPPAAGAQQATGAAAALGAHDARSSGHPL